MHNVIVIISHLSAEKLSKVLLYRMVDICKCRNSEIKIIIYIRISYSKHISFVCNNNVDGARNFFQWLQNNKKKY